MIIQSVGVVLTLVGLWLVFRQLRAARYQNVVAALGQLVQLMRDVNQVFIDNSALREFFYDGVAIDRSDDRYQAALSVSEMFLDVFDHILTHISQMPEIWDKHQEFWENWVVTMFKQAPVLRTYYSTKTDWYTEEMAGCFERAMAELAEGAASA